MTVMIIGKQDDLTSMCIQEKLVLHGEQVLMFDTTKFPYELQVSFDAENPTNGTVRAFPGAPPIQMADIRGVFRRWSDGYIVPDDESDPLVRNLVYRNIESAANTFFRCLEAFWVNTLDATDMHRVKGFLLKQLRADGIRIPDTLITNTPQDVVEFYHQQNGSAIFKPVFSWASTEMLTEDHLTDDSLSRLSNMPLKLQEYIPGRDIRIYLVGDELYAMEICSETLDFRDEPYAERVPIQLPDDVAERCHKIAKTLGLVYAGIDMRRTPDGEYVFFEANPSPVFLFDEETSGYPISDNLVSLLLSKPV